MLRFDWNFVFTVINLIVLYLLLKKFLIGPISAIMEKRKTLIESQIAEACKIEQKAIELKQKYEETIKGTDATVNEMLEEARRNSNRIYEQKLKDSEEESLRILKDAEKAISLEREKTLRDMLSEVAGLAMVAAQKLVNDNSEGNTNQSQYDNFLKKVGDTHESNSN